MKKQRLVALVFLLALMIPVAVPLTRAQGTLSKPTVTLPSSDWKLTADNAYPTEVSEHDPAGAGLLTYTDLVTYDLVTIYYEKASTTAYTSANLQDEVVYIYQRDHNETMIDSGSSQYAGVTAGFAKGSDPSIPAYLLELVFVKGGYYFNVYAYYYANAKSESIVNSLINSVDVPGNPLLSGIMLYVIIGVVAAVVVIVAAVVVMRSRKKKPQRLAEASAQYNYQSSAQANSLRPASKTLAPEEQTETGIPVGVQGNELRKNFESETRLTGIDSHGIAGRVATGYINLDGLLYGGIPSNFAVALTSPACDERNSIIKGFLSTGVKDMDVTIYLTIDPAPAKELAEKLPSSLYLFVCNPQAYSLVKKSDNAFVLDGVQNLTAISIALDHAIRKLDRLKEGSRRACIDIISDVLLEHGPVQTRRWLTELITGLRSVGFTTLAVINPQMHSAEDFYAILGLFEGEIDIHEGRTERGLARFLRIKRMSNQKYIKNEVLLTGDT